MANCPGCGYFVDYGDECVVCEGKSDADDAALIAAEERGAERELGLVLEYLDRKAGGSTMDANVAAGLQWELEQGRHRPKPAPKEETDDAR